MLLYKARSLILALLLVTLTALDVATSWDPDAGLVRSLTRNKPVNVTSNPASAGNIIDGNPETHWQSGACFPTGFIPRGDLNVLLGACANNQCSATGDATDIELATDGTFYGGPLVTVIDGEARFTVSFLPDNSNIRRVLIRGRFDGQTRVILKTNVSETELIVLTSDDSYEDVIILGDYNDVLEITMTSTSNFQLSEIASMINGPCYEMAVVSLQYEAVGVIRTRHWAGGNAYRTELLLSRDGLEWELIAVLDPNNSSTQFTRLEVEIETVHIAIKHYVIDGDYNKVYVWDISAWDTNGRWGPYPSAEINPSSIRDVLGVNGIWGWQTGSYSDLLPPELGTDLYNNVSSHARNYHNMNWDVHEPTSIPDYEAMANGEGTEVHWWLNWDQEYAVWDSDFDIAYASVQFTNKPSDMPVEEWLNPYQNGYNFGYAFAEHFGGNTGTGHLHTMEIGNEPWDYPVGFYPEVLHGMTHGATDASAGIHILPCALQADDEIVQNNYIGLNVNETIAPYLDGINSHIYSFLHLNDSRRIAVHPEHPDSAFNSVRNMLRWRSANMPGKPVWVTEWGWDSDGVNEDCANTECVSEYAQALYGVRGLMVLARLGIPRAAWFFFANSENCNTLFCRSGLTSSVANQFAKKRVFRAFESLLHLAADTHFIGIIQQDKNAFIYRLGSVDGIDTHLLMWRPVDAEDSGATEAVFPFPYLPEQTWEISGETAVGGEVTNPVVSDGVWTATVSAVPIISKLQ